MVDDEFTLNNFEKMLIRKWKAGHQIMGRIVETDWDDEPSPYDGTYSEE